MKKAPGKGPYLNRDEEKDELLFAYCCFTTLGGRTLHFSIEGSNNIARLP